MAQREGSGAPYRPARPTGITESVGSLDARVLGTLARLARGIKLHAASEPAKPPIEEAVEVENTIGWSGHVPHLFLQLELGAGSVEDGIEGSLVMLLGRKLVAVSRRGLSLPPLPYRYVCADGTIWRLSTTVWQSGSTATDAQRTLSVVCDTTQVEQILSSEGLASMPFYALTPAGWEAAGSGGGAPSKVPRSSRADDKNRVTEVDTEPTGPLQPSHEKPVTGGDEPDENGYILRPMDPAAYVPLTNVLTHHTPSGWPLNAKAIVKIVEDFRTHHVRWTRPLDKEGQPITNRRSIHLGDWHAHCKRATQRDPEGFPVVPEADVEATKAAIRRSKSAGK